MFSMSRTSRWKCSTCTFTDCNFLFISTKDPHTDIFGSTANLQISGLDKTQKISCRKSFQQNQWVFGSVRQDTKNCFQVPVPVRSAETLELLISNMLFLEVKSFQTIGLLIDICHSPHHSDLLSILLRCGTRTNEWGTD